MTICVRVLVGGSVRDPCAIYPRWTAFTPLIFALLHHDSAVGSNRLAFNITMALLSPIAGVFAERAAVRKRLSYTTLGRFAVWGLLLPGAFLAVLFSSPEDVHFSSAEIKALFASVPFVAYLAALLVLGAGLQRRFIAANPCAYFENERADGVITCANEACLKF